MKRAASSLGDICAPRPQHRTPAPFRRCRTNEARRALFPLDESTRCLESDAFCASESKIESRRVHCRSALTSRVFVSLLYTQYARALFLSRPFKHCLEVGRVRILRLASAVTICIICLMSLVCPFRRNRGSRSRSGATVGSSLPADGVALHSDSRAFPLITDK